MKTQDKAVYFGMIGSLVVNLILWNISGTRPMSFLQFFICIALPIAILVIVLFCTFVVVNSIRGSKRLNQWTVEDAQRLLEQDVTPMTKYFAKTYLFLINPLCFFGGWILISGGFYSVVVNHFK